MMGRKVKIILLLFISLVAATLFINMYMNLRGIDLIRKNGPFASSGKSFLQREEINSAISEKIRKGKIDNVLEIYAGVTGDPELVRMIINSALSYDIPVSLLFSIIYVESSFNPEAINKNANGTYDYGLMALNSKTFRGYTKEELSNPETNLRLGCEYLSKLKKRYKTWGEAVIHYNGLYTKGAGSYMVRVMEMERELEKLYNTRI